MEMMMMMMMITKNVKFIQESLPTAVFNLLQNFVHKCEREASERTKCSRVDASLYQIPLLHNIYEKCRIFCERKITGMKKKRINFLKNIDSF
jgi:hypothetical protein